MHVGFEKKSQRFPWLEVLILQGEPNFYAPNGVQVEDVPRDVENSDALATDPGCCSFKHSRDPGCYQVTSAASVKPRTC